MVGQQQIDGLLRRLKATYSAAGDANCTTPILRKDLAAMIRVLEYLAALDGAPLSMPDEAAQRVWPPAQIPSLSTRYRVVE